MHRKPIPSILLGLKRAVAGFAFWVLLSLLACCLALASSVAAANSAEQIGERPKIGLVLSGGGARGAAHVGVIKVLEELKVPIDFIAGTSLGSVVGALYALGHSPEQLATILNTIDWNKGFVDELPRRRLPMRRKDEADDFLINFELGVRDGALSLPRGLIQGHSLHLLLKSLVGGASLIQDFDSLPIPFRAIATDVEKSKTVVLGEGDLAKSLQASMSIPGIYSPVLIDEQLLVDGGVTNNLPIDVVRDMGADVVIAVDISTPLAEKESLQSVVDIVDQLTNILTRENVEQRIASLGEDDVYLQPDLSNFAASDFGKTPEIVLVGEQTARKFSDHIEALSLSNEDYAKYKASLVQPLTVPMRIKSLSLQQNSDLSDSLLSNRAGIGKSSRYGRQSNEPFKLDEFHRVIDAIYATGVFERVDYFYEFDKSLAETDADQAASKAGLPRITINAVEKTWGPDVVRFGFTLEDDFGGNNNFNVSAGYTRKAVNRLGGDIRVIAQLGETPRILTEYFQPFDENADYFALLAFDHQQYSQGEFTGDTQTGDFRLRRNQLGLFMGRQFGTYADFRMGFQMGNGRIKRRIGDVSLTELEDFREGAFELEYRYDTLDSKKFPSDGSLFKFRFSSSLEVLYADDEYDAVLVEALSAYRKGSTRWAVSMLMQTVTRNVVPVQNAFSQGSLLTTSGLKRNVEVGQHAGRVSLVTYRPLTNESVAALEYPVYFGAAVELGRVFQNRDEVSANNLLLSGSVFIAADTPVGPLYLGLGASQGEGITSLLSLGLTF